MSKFDENSDTQKFWNEEGGLKWVDNINLVESMLVPMSDKLIVEIAAKSGESVLDVGCGGGITSLKLASQVGESGKVLGVDVSEPILDIARQRGEGVGNLEFQQADAASFALGDDKFDVITSRFGVMFFDDPIAAFKNLHSALKASGRLIFICWRTLDENPWMGGPAKVAIEILPPPANAEKPDPTAPGPFSLGNSAHLENILASAGFNNINLQAVDMDMPMGSLDDATSFFMALGPAADATKEANEEERNAVYSAIRQVLEKYDTPEGAKTPASIWMVNASK